jgi:hypothetical protein
VDYVPYLAIDLDSVLMKARRSNHPLRKLTRGFDVFPRLTTPARSTASSAVWLALEHLALYTLHVDDYVERRKVSENLAVIGELRGYVQHRLMGLLGSVCGSPIESGDNDFISLALLAAAIYSFTCVFPLAEAPFARLSKRIRASYEVLEQVAIQDSKVIPAQAQPITAWILCMGAIAASEMPDNIWYAAALARCLRKQHIESWPKLRVLLLDFLWLPMTNDEDGMRVWAEVETLFVIGKETEERGQGGW